MRFLKRAARASRKHEQQSGISSPQEPTGIAVVRRFQGKFSCGCEWPLDQLAPEECPNHGEGTFRVYATEQVLEMTNVEIQEVANGPA